MPAATRARRRNTPAYAATPGGPKPQYWRGIRHPRHPRTDRGCEVGTLRVKTTRTRHTAGPRRESTAAPAPPGRCPWRSRRPTRELLATPHLGAEGPLLGEGRHQYIGARPAALMGRTAQRSAPRRRGPGRALGSGTGEVTNPTAPAGTPLGATATADQATAPSGPHPAPGLLTSGEHEDAARFHPAPSAHPHSKEPRRWPGS